MSAARMLGSTPLRTLGLTNLSPGRWPQQIGSGEQTGIMLSGSSGCKHRLTGNVDQWFCWLCSARKPTCGRRGDVLSWQAAHIVGVQQRRVAQVVRPEQGRVPAGHHVPDEGFNSSFDAPGIQNPITASALTMLESISQLVAPDRTHQIRTSWRSRGCRRACGKGQWCLQRIMEACQKQMDHMDDNAARSLLQWLLRYDFSAASWRRVNNELAGMSSRVSCTSVAARVISLF